MLNTGEMLYPSWSLSGGFAFCQRFLGDGTQGGALYQRLNLMLMASVFVESSGMKKLSHAAIMIALMSSSTVHV